MHESCDCWRIESGDTKNGKGFREFRRLCITQHEQQGGRACNNTTKLPPSTLKLGYQQVGVQAGVGMPCVCCAPGKPPSQAMGHPTWYEAPLDALRVLLQEQPRPDVVILNVGLWAGTSDGARTENPSTFVLQQYRTLLGNASAMVGWCVVHVWGASCWHHFMTISCRTGSTAWCQACVEDHHCKGIPVNPAAGCTPS